MIEEIVEQVLVYDRSELAAWTSGVKDWAPHFVDAHSLNKLRNQPQYHFGETFVLRHYAKSGWEGTGFYTFGNLYAGSPSFSAGTSKLKERVPSDKLEEICRHHRLGGLPDLFLYHTTENWIKFVEVKKEADRIQPSQLRCLALIRAILGAPVEVIYLREGQQRYTPKTYVLDLAAYTGHLKRHT